VIDFIDLRRPENRAALDAALREAFAEDGERTRIAPVSEFGLVEMTRRRTGPSVRQALHDACPACRGRGVVRSPSSGALRGLREARARLAGGSREVVLRASPDVAAWLRARRGDALRGGVRLVEDPTLPAGSGDVE
jgi:Ribonuclease G/E